jgi:single-stranded DNA-binding protein
MQMLGGNKSDGGNGGQPQQRRAGIANGEFPDNRVSEPNQNFEDFDDDIPF